MKSKAGSDTTGESLPRDWPNASQIQKRKVIVWSCPFLPASHYRVISTVSLSEISVISSSLLLNYLGRFFGITISSYSFQITCRLLFFPIYHPRSPTAPAVASKDERDADLPTQIPTSKFTKVGPSLLINDVHHLLQVLDFHRHLSWIKSTFLSSSDVRHLGRIMHAIRTA